MGDSIVCCFKCFRSGTHLAGWALVVAAGILTAQAAGPGFVNRNKELEKAIGIHHFNEKGFAVYDAFSHVNRIPKWNSKGEFPEEPIDTAGAIFTRLSNQEGRVQIKLPPGMTKDHYFAFKTFFSPDTFYHVQAGNCGACHSAGSFDDGREHIVTKGGSPTKTPSLRNLKRTDKELSSGVMAHIAASKQKKSGEADEIDDMFAMMIITEQDVPKLVKFIKLLNDVADAKDMEKVKEKFRPLVNESKPVDVVGKEARGEDR